MTEYETKDSGERIEFNSGMQRDTQTGKPRFDLTQPVGIPFEEQLLTRFAMLMSRGADKYSERNWEHADSEEEMARMKASGLRHFMQWYAGETDEDHAAAVMFNMMAFEATRYKLSLRVSDQITDGFEPALDRLIQVTGTNGSGDAITAALHRALNRQHHDEIPRESLGGLTDW